MADNTFFDAIKGIPTEFARGTSRIKQDLGIAPDPNQYKKTPQGEAIANSDFAKGARNYVRLQKEGMGIKATNDDYEAKGGSIKQKTCKMSTHDSNPKHKDCW
jgi:hypothetical protein